MLWSWERSEKRRCGLCSWHVLPTNSSLEVKKNCWTNIEASIVESSSESGLFMHSQIIFLTLWMRCSSRLKGSEESSLSVWAKDEKIMSFHDNFPTYVGLGSDTRSNVLAEESLIRARRHVEYEINWIECLSMLFGGKKFEIIVLKFIN